MRECDARDGTTDRGEVVLECRIRWRALESFIGALQYRGERRRIAIRKRAKDDGIDDRKDPSRRADADREGQSGDRCVRRCATHTTQRVSDIGGEIAEPSAVAWWCHRPA